MNGDSGPIAGALMAFQGGKYAGCSLADLPSDILGLLFEFTRSGAVRGEIKRLHRQRRRGGKGSAARRKTADLLYGG